MTLHRLTVRVPPEMHQALATRAADHNISIAHLVRDTLSGCLHGPGCVINGIGLPQSLVVRLRDWHRRGRVISATKDIRNTLEEVGLREAKAIAKKAFAQFKAKE